MTSRCPDVHGEPMPIVSDRETPAQVAALVQHHQPSASFRLDLAIALLRQLVADANNNGFPNAAQVLALGEAAAADAAGVAVAIDHALARREAIAVARKGDMSLAQARASVPAPDANPLDATLDRSRSALAFDKLVEAAQPEGATR